MPSHDSAKAAVQATLENPGVIAVIRTPSDHVLHPLCCALVDAGVTALEITLTTPNAIQAIGIAARDFSSKVVVGVGTVLSLPSCEQAIDAGARFVVSPIVIPELVPLAQSRGCPVFLGAYTPTEAYRAFMSGADYIKLFPADGLGPGYVRSLLAPMPQLRIVPTGGVDKTTAPAFIRAGCPAVGVGSSILSSARILSQDWKAIEEETRELISIVRAAKREASGRSDPVSIR